MDRFADLRENVLSLLRPYARKVSVFGSFACGEETSESDIDLSVELKPRELRPHLGFKWFGLWDELEEILGRKVDLALLPTSQWGGQLLSSPATFSPVIRPGLPKSIR
jgi:uncharacterized protein